MSRYRAAGVFLSLITLAFATHLRAQTTPEAVQLRQTAAGTYLTDRAGLALYTFADDGSGGTGTCLGPCAELWPPLEAGPGSVAAPWSVAARSDRRRQLAYRGRPLYRSRDDTWPGSRMGEAASLAGWRLAFEPRTTPSGFSIIRLRPGWVLATASADPLFASREPLALDQEATVQPMRAAALARSLGDWTIQATEPGIRQWAYQGRLLYRLTGQRDARFELVVLEAVPTVPPWVTFQEADTGEVLADAHGKTLYVVRNMAQVEREKTCLEECLKRYWRSVEAEAVATPVGNWSIVTDKTGARIWAYMGLPVWTHVRDQHPGDTAGAGFGVGQGIGGGWRPLLASRLLPTD